MSGEKNVPEKLHSELGASVASRWMACPGSVQLIRQVPPAPNTEFAQEGTRAHAVGELSLSKDVPVDTFLGMALEGGEVTDDMVDFVGVYVRHCVDLKEQCSAWWVERRFNLLSLNPPAPMFGTADFIAYDAVSRTLHVVDLKYGQGVVVEAKGNKQLRYYGLGAALSLDPAQYPIEKVVMTIVQPRAGHPDGPIRSDEMSFIELVNFADDLIEAAKRTQQPGAPLNPGSHCRFCPAAAVCPAKLEYAQALAQIEFSVEQPALPPAPDVMGLKWITDHLPQMDVLESWIKASRAYVYGALERGEDVPGYKLVQKRPTRKWADEGVARQYLEASGFTSDEINVPADLKSPAQIEKLLGKKDFAASPIAALVEKKSSGYNMVPSSDPRPAVSLTAGEEFALLTAGE